MSHKYAFRFCIDSQMEPSICAHYFKLRVIPQNTPCQHLIDFNLDISPQPHLMHTSDVFGNSVQYGSYHFSHQCFKVVSSGVVQCDNYFVSDDSPADMYALSGPLTNWNGDIRRWTQGQLLSQDGPTAAEKIMHAVYARLTYERFVTDNSTTAISAFQLQKGVCQDYAHVMIAACRSIGLYARYANGMVLGEGETHAWVEVYEDGGWRGYDPTRNHIIIDGYIKLAHGRDVSDCPTNRGRFYQWTQEQMMIKVDVVELT